jgi:hypothetical protein
VSKLSHTALHVYTCHTRYTSIRSQTFFLSAFQPFFFFKSFFLLFLGPFLQLRQNPWLSPAAPHHSAAVLSTKQRWAGRGLEFHKLLLQRCQERSQPVIEIVESASVAEARGSSIYTRTATSLRAIKTEPQTLRWAPFKAFSTAFSNSNVM